MTRPPDLLLPLSPGQHRRLSGTRIADILYIAGWLGQSLRALCGPGHDPATKLCVERWAEDHGHDLTSLAQCLSNDALLRAEAEIEAEDDPLARERAAAADLRMRQAREEMAV